VDVQVLAIFNGGLLCIRSSIKERNVSRYHFDCEWLWL
jgi:hypothetical protein